MLRNRRLPAREKRVSFRVSPEEYAALESAAQGAGATVSGFVRGALPTLLSEAGRIRKRPRRSGEALPVLLVLARLHRNVEALRQWATGADAPVHGGEVAALCLHLEAVERALAQVAEGREGLP